MVPEAFTSRNVADVYENGTLKEIVLFRRLTLVTGFLAAATALAGIITARAGITLIGSAGQFRTIALSAALTWIIFGSVLAVQAVRPLHWITRQVLLAVLVIITAVQAVEFSYNIQGSHFFVETFFISAGTWVIGPGSTPISPAAALLAVISGFALIEVVRGPGSSARWLRIPDLVSALGLAVAVFSFTFVLSYAYSNPLLYHTQFIPIAFSSALAAFFMGTGLTTTTGPGGIPARYLTGHATTARLLRVFVPLVIGIILFENFGVIGLSSLFGIRDAILLSTTLVIFLFATVIVVSWVSRGMGEDLEQAELALVEKNENLGALNEELMAIEEELRQANEALVAHERQLVQKNDDLNAMNEELTATQEELRTNLDELSRIEKNLRESREDLRTITEIFPVQISIARKDDGRILFTNPAYDRAFGFAQGELLGHRTPELYADPDDRTEVLNLFRKQGYVENHEVVVRRKDGTPFWINVSLRPITFAGQEALIAASVDITDRKKAESELKDKNEDLNAACEEIAATQEELRTNLDELTGRERQLNEALAEKEVLLSEIHHRVKNNLAAFISLLSLEGSYDDTPSGQALKKDLQNRARSMALIHETLYRTRRYAEVDMQVYLSTLIQQVVGTYTPPKSFRTIVETEGISLDLPRATPTGLIINELVTNSLKYAFPGGATSPAAGQNDPCMIWIRLSKDAELYTLRVADNGIGLPAGFVLSSATTLGLKLVNFLAKHQLRAEIEINTDHGTEFIFRFPI